MKTKKNIFLWILYDFANSFVSIVFFLYFAQWLIIDKGIADIYYNLAFTVSAVLLLFTVPITGILLDKHIRRITGLRFSTVFTALFYGISAYFALTNEPTYSLIFFTLGLYAYLLSFTFYTPLINDICGNSRRGLISGLGIAANYLGQFGGLLVALPFSSGTISFFDATHRAETLLPAIIIFSVLSLPMLLFFMEPRLSKSKLNITLELRNLFVETKKMLAIPSVLFFFVAYFLFNDALLTASNNFPIFLEQVWHVSDAVKTYILLGIIIMCAIGGILSGYLADKFGHKRTLTFVLFGWIIILPLLALLQNFVLFVICTSLMGLWYGANWAVSRSVMSYVAPPKKHNLAFAYFGLVERASSFIGPIIWGLCIAWGFSLGSFKYRLAVILMTIFVILGLLALAKVKDDKN